MNRHSNLKISDSAFLVNQSRAKNVELSRDIFARLWVSEATQSLWDEMNRVVYPHDAVEMGVRNRFFLDQIDAAHQLNDFETFINVGAGFTSYPFLVDESMKSIELDLPHVMAFKKQRILEWQERNLIPQRAVEFLALDLNCNLAPALLIEHLSPTVAKQPTFVLLEGLTYYLRPESIKMFFSWLNETQKVGSLLAFDYWTPALLTHPVCQSFKKFLAEQVGFNNPEFNHFELSDVIDSTRYEVLVSSDVVEQEKQFCSQRVLTYENALVDSFAVLRKIA